MNDTQTWATIAALIGLMGYMLSLMHQATRDIRNSVHDLRGSLSAEIQGLRTEMNVRFEAVDAKFEARFDAVDHRLDALESDMTTIKRALIGKISA